jgi:hypothetical protein
MPDPNAQLLEAFDGHQIEDVRAALAAGADVKSPIQGKLATDWLLEQYHRSDRLQECLRLIVERGATYRDPTIALVVFNDVDAIRQAVTDNPSLLSHRTSLQCSFTSLEKATLLHVAAEYGHLEAAQSLIDLGADVNATAGVDQYGLNGHTPLFHAVNSNANRSAPIMKLLVDAGADCEYFVKGIQWGRCHSWETTFFDVTPISFAQMGMLPQVHRKELDQYENIKFLLRAAGRAVPPLDNVPNHYLVEGH